MFEDLENTVTAALGGLSDAASGLGEMDDGFTLPPTPEMGDEFGSMFTTPGAVAESLGDVAEVLQGLPGFAEGDFATGLGEASNAYQAAFMQFGTDLAAVLQPPAGGPEGPDYVDLIQTEFAAAAGAFAIAGDAILTALAVEIGQDEEGTPGTGDDSGVAYAAGTLLNALDASGAVVSAAFAEGGLEVATAAAGTFVDGIAAASAALMGAGGDGMEPPTPGSDLAAAIAENNVLPEVIDGTFDALTGDAIRTIGGEIANGAEEFALLVRGGAGELASAIMGDDMMMPPNPLDGIGSTENPIVDAIESAIGSENNPFADFTLENNPVADFLSENSGVFDPEMIAGEFATAITTVQDLLNPENLDFLMMA